MVLPFLPGLNLCTDSYEIILFVRMWQDLSLILLLDGLAREERESIFGDEMADVYAYREDPLYHT